MLKATDIFQRLSAPTVDGILTHLQGADKPTYRVAIQTLASARKLRPIFVERKPRPERHAWMQTALARPQNEPDKLRAAVDALLTKYPADAVAVYLHSFQGMDIAGWPPLGEMLENDPRLQLTPAPAAS